MICLYSAASVFISGINLHYNAYFGDFHGGQSLGREFTGNALNMYSTIRGQLTEIMVGRRLP